MTVSFAVSVTVSAIGSTVICAVVEPAPKVVVPVAVALLKETLEPVTLQSAALLPDAAARAVPPSGILTVRGEERPIFVLVNVYTRLVEPSSCTEVGETPTVTVGRLRLPRLPAALMMPGPHIEVLQPPPEGKAVAEPWISESTWAGVSVGVTEKSSAATPATWGAAILVPE